MITFYTVRCQHCGAMMKIGDARSADEIKRMLENGEAVSGHAATCPSGWGRAAMRFDVTADPPKEPTS